MEFSYMKSKLGIQTDGPKMKKIALLLAGGFSLWAVAQNALTVKSTGTADKTFTLTEIVKIVPTSTTTTFYGAGNSVLYTLPTVGQKWVFASVSSSQISSSISSSVAQSSSSQAISSSGGTVAAFPTADGIVSYAVHDRVLTVRAAQNSQFTLLKPDGQIVAQSSSQIQWQTPMGAEQILILRVEAQGLSKNFLLRSR